MDFLGNPAGWISIVPVIILIFRLALLGATVYAFILFVKFANLGIKAFKIYIEKNRNH